MNIARSFRSSFRLPVPIALLIFAVLPVVAYASGFFALLGSLFSSNTDFQVKSGNSQTIALLQASGPQVKGPTGGGDIAIVNENSLVAPNTDSDASGGYANSYSNDQISIYVVHDGDTLSGIAKMFGVSVNTIIWANDIKSGKIAPGDQLIILPINGVEYTVKSGDTLKSIATKFKGDATEIAQFNNISPNAKLSAGDTIIIPDGEMTAATVSSSGSSIYTSGGSSEGSSPYSPPVGSHGSMSPTYIGYYMRPIFGGIKTQGIHGHNGVDLASNYGANIMAAADGYVIVAKSGGWNGGYGSYIVIKHGNGTQTLYGHLSQVDVSIGQEVTQGQVIGHMGSTGDSTGTHLHFEIRGATNPF